MMPWSSIYPLPVSRIVLTALLAPASVAEANVCAAGRDKYPEGARIEAYRVTGVRTRTPVAVYVLCRNGRWVWPSTGEVVTRVR
jgi:hypothetical protein